MIPVGILDLSDRTERDGDRGAYLGVKVSVVNVLVVQVDHSSAYITGQVNLLFPAQGNIFLSQKLLQTATIYILPKATHTRSHTASQNTQIQTEQANYDVALVEIQ